MSRVFISYRRQDSDSIAGRLSDALRLRLPKSTVFMDVDGVRPGQDFAQALTRTVAAADVMIVVIGPGWLNAAKPDRTRRLDDLGDFVRTEIVAALKEGLLVLPVLVQGASMPATGDLPDDIRDLAVRQASVLSTGSWKEDVEAIVSEIERLPTAGSRRTDQHRLNVKRSRVMLEPRQRRVLLAVTTIAVVMAIIGVAYWVLRPVQVDERSDVEAIGQDLQYGLPLDVVTSAASRVQTAAARSGDPAVIDLAVERLKRLVVVSTDKTDKGREIRRRAIESIKALRHNNLTMDFGADALRGVDLVDADLSRASLKAISLARGFMIRTDFSAADLTEANLGATWVRNSDFGAATMTGANINDMDWYNAQGFDADQLGSIKRSTLAPCPKDDSDRASESAFRKKLGEDYGFKWEQMGSDRDQLVRWWSIYAQPGGLCDQVDRWRSGS